jgi:hypothetical protein
MKLEFQILAKDRYKNVAVINRLIGSQTCTFDDWISKGNTDIINK